MPFTKTLGQPVAEKFWNMVHYDVQLIGGIVLHNGKIEMAAVKGKTLVSTCRLTSVTPAT